MKKALLLSCVAVAMMASCSLDEEYSNSGEKFNGNVTLTAEPYTFADGDTRTTLANTGSKIAFAWDDDEAIGIFPIAPTTNVQAKQVLKNGSGNGTTSSFDGAGWALMYGNTYAAYYPYQQKEYDDYTKIPIDMTGQAQNGNNSLDHIGAGYDYMYAVASVPTNGNVNFDFKHATSIIMLELTMPDADTWKSVTLASAGGSKVWTTSATMNVATGEVIPKETSSEVTLSLNNVSTTASDKTLTLYLAVLPTTTGDLTLTAKTSAKKSFTASITGKTLVAGKAYRFVTSFVENIVLSRYGYENGHEWVDLGLSVKWATVNVGTTSETSYGKYFAFGETELQDWGGSWRMPTRAELSELVNKCYWVWTSGASSYYYSGSGYIVYAAKSPSDMGQAVYNGKTPSSSYSLSDPHIFLPATGYRNYSTQSGVGVSAYYWSSSARDENEIWALDFHVNTPPSSDGRGSRTYSYTVRAVCE